MESDYVYPDIPLKTRKSNINNEINMYVTTGRPGPRPSQASVMNRTVQRSKDGAYELAGGGNVIYNLDQRRVSIESMGKQRTGKSCFKAHQKTIGCTILIIMVLGISVGVGVKFRDLGTSKTNENDTGIYY